MEEDGDVSEAGVVDAVAEVREEFHLGGVAVGFEDIRRLDGGVRGKDVVIQAMEEEDWSHWGLGTGIGRKAGGDAKGAAAGDEACGFVGKPRQGVENGHGALGEAEEDDVGGGDGVGRRDLGDEGVQLACNGLEAVFVAEGPAGVPEPLVALARWRRGSAVRGINRQAFRQVTEDGLEDRGEGDEVVAIGTETV